MFKTERGHNESGIREVFMGTRGLDAHRSARPEGKRDRLLQNENYLHERIAFLKLQGPTRTFKNQTNKEHFKKFDISALS